MTRKQGKSTSRMKTQFPQQAVPNSLFKGQQFVLCLQGPNNTINLRLEVGKPLQKRREYVHLSTVSSQPNLKKVSTSQLLLPQHQSTHPKGPESASIEIPPFRSDLIKFSKTVFYEVNFVSQCSLLQVHLLSKFGSERGISIDADSGPLGYVCLMLRYSS